MRGRRRLCEDGLHGRIRACRKIMCIGAHGTRKESHNRGQPIMRIVESAERYCKSHNVARTVIFSANRFARLISNKSIRRITKNDLERFADCAATAGLSASTIKGTIKDLRTLAIDAGLKWVVPRVRVPAPEPAPTPMDHINAIWPHLAAWCRQSVALMYWTCFRLDDVISLQCRTIAADETVIRLQAHKTQRNHAFPVPTWLTQYLGPVLLPFSGNADYKQALVRAEMERASLAGKVAQVYPRNVRQAGITAWSRANGMAGSIAHGSGLSGSVMQHYVSPLQVLEDAMPKVRVPDAMRGKGETADTETALLANFRRLDPSAQSIISLTAERLSG